MEPDILQSHADTNPCGRVPEPGPQSPAPVGKGMPGMVQGGLSTLYLHFLSLRVGLLDWYFCFKQIQWDLLRWIHASFELATDFFFCWAQNILLASMMLLLLAWRARDGAKERGWRSVLRGLAPKGLITRVFSLLNACCRYLESLVARIVWGLAFRLTCPIACITQALESTFQHAVEIASEEEDEDEEETALVPMPCRANLLPKQEERT
ncbi:Hypothetical predicted protein [Podarcis lilfordi]|nr:Hypothetical predicted protein [Podarcis lilfordi]